MKQTFVIYLTYSTWNKRERETISYHLFTISLNFGVLLNYYFLLSVCNDSNFKIVKYSKLQHVENTLKQCQCKYSETER